MEKKTVRIEINDCCLHGRSAAVALFYLPSDFQVQTHDEVHVTCERKIIGKRRKTKETLSFKCGHVL